MSLFRPVQAAKDVQEAMEAVSCRLESPCEAVIPFCILKFTEGSESSIEVEHLSKIEGSADSTLKPTWANLVESLPPKQCRMVVAQVPWTAHSDSVTRTRLVLLHWVPSHGPTTKERMQAAMFAKGVTQLIHQWAGMPILVHAADVDELGLDQVQEKIRSRATVK